MQVWTDVCPTMRSRWASDSIKAGLLRVPWVASTRLMQLTWVRMLTWPPSSKRPLRLTTRPSWSLELCMTTSQKLASVNAAKSTMWSCLAILSPQRSSLATLTHLTSSWSHSSQTCHWSSRGQPEWRHVSRGTRSRSQSCWVRLTWLSCSRQITT